MQLEKKIEGKNKPINLRDLEDLISKAKKCVCLIYYEGTGSGFFCKIPLNFSSDEFMNALLTNNHVLTSKFFDNEKVLKINYQSQDREINMLLPRFKCTNEEMDFSIIQILPYDDIKDFYDINENIIDKYGDCSFEGKEICIFQHPLGGELSYAPGEILKISDFKIEHSTSTEEG